MTSDAKIRDAMRLALKCLMAVDHPHAVPAPWERHAARAARAVEVLRAALADLESGDKTGSLQGYPGDKTVDLQDLRRRLLEDGNRLGAAIEEYERRSSPEPLTRKQAAIVGAYTKTLLGPMSDLHELVEYLMGRPVFTHEMASLDLWMEVREKVLPLFLAICVKEAPATRSGGAQ